MKMSLRIKKIPPGLRTKIWAMSPAVLLTFTYLFFDYHTKAAAFMSPDRFLRPLIVMCLLLIPVFYVIHLITGDIAWSSLYLYFFVLVLYASEEYFEAVFLLILIVLATWTIIYFILKKKLINVRHVTAIIVLLPVFLFSITLVKVTPIYLEPDWRAYINGLQEPQVIIKPMQPLPNELPDIYYIVLDGYGRTDILDEYYGYDNSNFVNYLTSKGFTVPTGVQSNYAKTVASVSSTLNINYIHTFMDGMENSLFWWQAKPYIQKSIVKSSLEDMGYRTISIATDWDITNDSNVDMYFKPRPIQLTEYEGNLLEKSRLNFLGPQISRLAFYPTNTLHREMVNYNFATLAETVTIPGPKFVFAHIVAPHPPFVFDKNGKSISPGYGFTFNDADDFPGTDEEYRIDYTGQVAYVNQLLEKTVNTILSQSKTPPIIILQADHGPGMMTDFATSENTCLKERFSIFAAYYLPGKKPEVIPNNITPVNIFRIIFNEYFSTELPLLNNASYYFKDTIYIFRAEDITAKLNDPTYNNACDIFTQ